jgi:hypothetical protein
MPRKKSEFEIRKQLRISEDMDLTLIQLIPAYNLANENKTDFNKLVRDLLSRWIGENVHLISKSENKEQLEIDDFLE